jgi:hypothetical protein
MTRWMLSLGFLAAVACNYGRQQEIVATARFSLTAEECQRLTDPAYGGGTIEGTYVAVAGAEFPPITRYYPGLDPCRNPDAGAELLRLTVGVPEGERRALALGIVGPQLFPGSVELPALAGMRFDLRRVFFGGGEIVEEADLLRGTLDLYLDPFVNVLGRVRRGGEPVRARIRFFQPQSDSFCLRGCERCNPTDPNAFEPALTEVLTVASTDAGLFFAPVPYRAPQADFCDPLVQGNDLLALSASDAGEVALFVPGRAGDRGSQLQPGMLLTEVQLFLQRPQEIVAAELPVVTGVSLLPDRSSLWFYLSGYGLDTFVQGATLPLSLSGPGLETGVSRFFLVEEVSRLGLGEMRLGVRSELTRSYQPFTVGGTKAPSTLYGKVLEGEIPLVPERLAGAFRLELGPQAGIEPLTFDFLLHSP